MTSGVDLPVQASWKIWDGFRVARGPRSSLTATAAIALRAQ